MIKYLPGGMHAADFLERYWQKQPCLIRQAIGGFQTFISKQELFALSCRQEVESRIVLEADGDYPWQVSHGPFHESDFIDLPLSHWTLLVQNTDLHLPGAAAFLRQFRFIPNWRIDDLMMSFAPEHGSVGPHLDSYDVFLFQAMGKRRWSINTHSYSENDFVEGLDLRIVDNFEVEQEWLLEPGDMLYLPPGVAHHGVALEDCMTFSIGFRAPSSHELVGHYVDDMLASAGDQRYSDPDLRLQQFSGEITQEDLGKIDGLFRSALPDNTVLSEWFGRFVTRLPDDCEATPVLQPLDAATFIDAIRERPILYKNTATRSAFIRRDDYLTFFVNGEIYTLPVALEEFICRFTETDEFENPFLRQNMPTPEFAVLLCQLYNSGIIIIEAGN